jgi:hypothetical protein
MNITGSRKRSVSFISEYVAATVAESVENTHWALHPALEVSLVLALDTIHFTSSQGLHIVRLEARESSSTIPEENGTAADENTGKTDQGNSLNMRGRKDEIDSKASNFRHQKMPGSRDLESSECIDNVSHRHSGTQAKNLAKNNIDNDQDRNPSQTVTTSASGMNTLQIQKRNEEPRLTPSQFIATNKELRESVRLTIMMSCAFAICATLTVPYFMIHMFRHSPHFPTVYIISIMLVCVSMCLNPILFGLMNMHYRKAYKTLLTRCYKCQFYR